MAAPFFHSVGDLALTLFRPPPDATSGQVRRSGAFGLLVGGTLFTLAIAGLIGLGRAGVDVAHLRAHPSRAPVGFVPIRGAWRRHGSSR